MKNSEVIHINENKTALVIYNRFDMGNKYKIYTIRDGIKKYYMSFESITQAVKCCDMIP